MAQIQKISIVLFLVAAFGACSPVPLHTLSTEEKTADMYWIYSQFDQNYAPLALKEKEFGFKFNDLKAKYLTAAAATQSNAEFYDLMFNFVSEFHDAHTSALLTASTLEGRAQIAYLGFSGKRVGGSLSVTDLLPTIDPEKSMYPIQIEDKIEKLDGVALKDIVKNEMVKFRNLGNDESNLTYHMNKIFSRLSIQNGLPKNEFAVLTVKRSTKSGEHEFDVRLPWVKKDLVTFTQEQAAAAKSKTPETATESVLKKSMEMGAVLDTFTQLLSGSNGALFLPSIIAHLMPNQTAFGFLKQYRFVDMNPAWTSPEVKEVAYEAAKALKLNTINQIQMSPSEDVKAQRSIPEDAIFIETAKIFPTYIRMEKATPASKSAWVAYMYLPTFSPDDDAAALAEVTQTISTLQQNKVNNLVIDLIDNGGGSLGLSLGLAQALSPKKVLMPDMQIRNSDTWIDEFDTDRRQGPSDTSRATAEKLYQTLKAGLNGSKRISDNVSAESLLPNELLPSIEMTDSLNIVLLTNEMCASACDIFSGIMRDNGLAKIVGAKTMGAGGNVVMHLFSPNAHLILNQTESLIVRRGSVGEGQYIENNGIEPDYPMAVNEDLDLKYDSVRRKAVSVLLGTTE